MFPKEKIINIFERISWSDKCPILVIKIMDLKFNRASCMIGIKSIFVTEPKDPKFNRHNNVIGNNPKFIAET